MTFELNRTTERNRWMLEEVQSHIAHQLNTLVNNGKSEAYVIVGNAGLYQTVFAVSSSTTPTATILTDDDSRVVNARAEGRPVAELLWNLGLASADGQLLGQCRRNDVVQLNRWPNFTRIHATPNSLKIAALLSSRATSPVLASRILDLDEAEVFSFYSAAASAGYAQVLNRTAVQEIRSPSVNPQRQSLISRLMTHLKSLQMQRKAA